MSRKRSYGPNSEQLARIMRNADLRESETVKFHYASPEMRYSTPLLCMPCAHRGCKQVSCKTLPYCPQHLVANYRLRIGRTTLQDENGKRFLFNGLFACDPSKDRGAVIFQTGQEIIPYLGEQSRDVGMLTERYGPRTATYSFASSNPTIYTDSSRLRGAGAMINTATADRENNAVFEDDTRPYAVIVAQKPIRNGEEILLDYGQNYLLHEDGITHKTTEQPRQRQLHPKLRLV